MNVLITGASGFVGSNLINYFQGQTSISLFVNSRKPLTGLKQLGDCSAKNLDENRINVVIHLAGIAHDLSNMYKPEDYYRVNFEGTKKIVNEFKSSSAQKFIFVSSIKAACDTSSSPAHEMIDAHPQTDYGKSKLLAEEYIRSELSERKSFYILRPAMMHGPGNKGNLNLLYRFAKIGIPFPFGGFHNQRSFHYIENFCWVIEKLINKEIESGIYHLADDEFLSTVELYRLISETIGKKPLVWNIPQGLVRVLSTAVGKKGMITKLTEDMVISNSKIKTSLGGAMPVSLRDGLRKTILSFDGK